MTKRLHPSKLRENKAIYHSGPLTKEAMPEIGELANALGKEASGLVVTLVLTEAFRRGCIAGYGQGFEDGMDAMAEIWRQSTK